MSESDDFEDRFSRALLNLKAMQDARTDRGYPRVKPLPWSYGQNNIDGRLFPDGHEYNIENKTFARAAVNAVPMMYDAAETIARLEKERDAALNHPFRKILNRWFVVRERIVGWFRLTPIQYFADFFITPTVTALYAYHSLRTSFGASWVLLFLVGLILWTLYEYALHRWVLHNHNTIFSEIHRMHHRNDKDFIGTPPWLTMIAYLFFWLIFGWHSSALMLGFSIGYIVYASLHTIFHYVPNVNGPIRALREHHEKHHRLSTYNHGISNTLWDHVFGTKHVA